MADRMDRIFNPSQDRSTNGVGSEWFDKHFGSRPNSRRGIPMSPSSPQAQAPKGREFWRAYSEWDSNDGPQRRIAIFGGCVFAAV